jgi:hypothetical protein
MTTIIKRRVLRMGLAGLVALVAFLALFLGPGPSVREAHAVIGRPVTPVSYAGVARRTTRRTVAAASVAAPKVAVSPVVVQPVVVAPAPKTTVVVPATVW